MKTLSYVLLIKIAVTIIFWCAPLLLAPDGLLLLLKMPVPDPSLFRRLLGAAYLALTVPYWFGYRAARREEYPAAAVWTGIVSNGTACLILLMYGLTGAWSALSVPAHIYLWGSAAATAVLTLAIAFWGPIKQIKR